MKIEQDYEEETFRKLAEPRNGTKMYELFSDDDPDRTLEDGSSAAARQGGQENRPIQRVRRRRFVIVNGHFRPYCSLDGVHMVSNLIHVHSSFHVESA